MSGNSTTYKCLQCNKVFSKKQCSKPKCPSCSGNVIILHGIKHPIDGFCGKCNFAKYLLKKNGVSVYQCLKTNITYETINETCQAL